MALSSWSVGAAVERGPPVGGSELAALAMVISSSVKESDRVRKETDIPVEILYSA